MDRAWFRRFGWFWRPIAAEGWLVTGLTVVLCGSVLWAADRHSHSVSDTLMGAFPYAGLFVVFWGMIFRKCCVAMRTQAPGDGSR